LTDATFTAEDVKAFADRTPAAVGDVLRLLHGLADEVGKVTGENGKEVALLRQRVDGLESSVLSLLADLQTAVDELKAMHAGADRLAQVPTT
jgi:hypothetical protein